LPLRCWPPRPGRTPFSEGARRLPPIPCAESSQEDPPPAVSLSRSEAWRRLAHPMSFCIGNMPERTARHETRPWPYRLEFALQ
jgi:hypothetical protein